MLQSMRSSAKYIFWFLIICFAGGFLLVETSGLLGRSPLTPGTTVGTVNGEDITYGTWQNAVQNLIEREQERLGRSLNSDERQRVEKAAFDQLVDGILLQQEFRRRDITVTTDEIRGAALYAPPPELLQHPELQTEGQFDPAKYQRFLRSPAAKQGGLLAYLESYYRTEIPREKLFAQVVSGVYVTDARLWRAWQDEYDSAQVSYVALRAQSVPDSAVSVSDAEIRAYFDAHTDEFERPGRAVVSVITLARPITAADSAAVRARILALRSEIVGGTPFDTVARRESHDTASAVDGGFLGRGTRGRFVPEFERAAFALRPGEISQPVLTQFGYHLIKVDERKGDTLSMRHILLRVQQSDSSAVLTDRRADSLANLAAAADKPEKFDQAAKTLGLPVARVGVFEGEPATFQGKYVPGLAAWAFSGARVGESSELLDADDAYYLARLDSLTPGGTPSVEAVSDEIRAVLLRQKKVETLMARAKQLVEAARGGSLEQAAQQAGQTVQQAGPFNRVAFVPGLGRFNEAIGASFGLPIGTVGGPYKTDDAAVVIRVDRRVDARREEFEAQKAQQRNSVVEGMRRKRWQDFLQNLRREATIEDRRKDIMALGRGLEA